MLDSLIQEDPRFLLRHLLFGLLLVLFFLYYESSRRDEAEEKSEIEDRIKHIKDEIKHLIAYDVKSKYMLLLDCSSLKKCANYKLELLIKGLLLFLFDCDEKPPVAIFNLASHDLLEISRIIALFYNKQGKSTKNMKNNKNGPFFC